LEPPAEKEQANAAVQARGPHPDGRPQSGRIIWTGQLRRGVPLSITGRRAAYGSVNGELPGVPVWVAVYPAELSSRGIDVYTRNTRQGQEAPGAQNGWNRMKYVRDPRKANQVIVIESPGPQNDWKGLSLRAEADQFSVVIIEWKLAQGR
jgi:hypothetical protein